MATRTIGTEIVLSGEQKFNDAMRGLNNNLKNLRTDMALVAAEFDGNADSMEALTAKQKVLESSVDQHRAKVDALRQMYEKQKEKYGENSAAADTYKQQLNQATVALLKEENSLKKTVAAIEDKVSADLAAKAAAAAAEKAAEEQAKAAEEQAKAQAEAAAAAEKLAKKQELLSKANPVNQVKKAAAGYKNLVERLAEAQEKTEQFAEKQKKAGELLARVSKPITVLPTLTGKAAVGFAKLGTAAMAGVAAIGTGGVIALTQMAGMAREAAEAAKTAQEAGETLTESQQQWLAYSDQLDALDASVASAKGALAGILLPMLSDLSTEGAAFLNDFSRDMTAAAGDTGAQTKVLTDYIVKGVGLIKEKLPEYVAMGKELFSGLGEGLSEAGPELLDTGLDLVMELLDGILDAAPQLATAGIALSEKLLQALIARGPDALASGVGMVTQIVTGLAQAAPRLIPMAGQLVTQLLTALVQNAPQLLQAGLELILGIISGIFNGLGEIGGSADEIIETFKRAFADSVDIFLDIGSDIIDLIQTGIEDAWDSLVSWFNNLWDNLFKGREVDVNVNSSGSGVDGSHASGLNYVPFDGYLARLHRGEMVLTSAEAAQYRNERSQPARIVNLTINTKTLNEADVNMVVDIVNRKLGEEL